MKFSELLNVLGSGGVIQSNASSSDPQILGISEDSRKTKPGDLFVARPGTKTSGAQFVADALAKGAVAIASAEPLNLDPAIPFAQIQNANQAIALFAHALAGWPARNIKMLAVTGTKGKTTVAYLLRSVINAAGHKCGMIGTVEIDDGSGSPVPADMTTPSSIDLVATLARMRDNHVTHCVMEVSSHALHQSRTAGIDFAVAIFTNLTGDHLDYHKTMEEYAAAKALLFENLKPDAFAIINDDDKWAARMIRNCPAAIWHYHIGGEIPEHGWIASNMVISSSGMELRLDSRSLESPKNFALLHPGKKPGPGNGLFYFIFSTPLVGRHNAYNLLSVFSAADALGIDVLSICDGLQNNMGAPGRLQRVQLENREIPFQVFVDYAHTHDSLENVLRALRQTMASSPQSKIENQKSKIPPRLICVFGCGGDRDRTKRPKMAKVAQSLADLVIVTSDNPRTENPGDIINEILLGFEGNVSSQVTVEPDRRLAIQHAIQLAQPNDVVLIAGKGHENYQIIGTTKHHFDDVEEAQAALKSRGL